VKFSSEHQPSRRHVFTRAECKRGYKHALAFALLDVKRYAWIWRKVRGYYRAARRR
jgi:hypothetical protein